MNQRDLLELVVIHYHVSVIKMCYFFKILKSNFFNGVFYPKVIK